MKISLMNDQIKYLQRKNNLFVHWIRLSPANQLQIQQVISQLRIQQVINLLRIQQIASQLRIQ